MVTPPVYYQVGCWLEGHIPSKRVLVSTVTTAPQHALNIGVPGRVCRDLVKEGFPLHEGYIPALLENIGDNEDDVIETVLATVTNAR